MYTSMHIYTHVRMHKHYTCVYICKYWVGQKVRLGFSVTSTNQLYFITWLYHGLLDGSQMSMEEHLGYFQLLEFMNKSVKYL